MAAVTTIAAGGWSTGSTVFSGGSGVGGVPTNADTVTITHAITLDTTAAVCDQLTINASGSLIASTAGDSKLIVDKGISTAANATAVVTLDMSSVPQYKCEVYWNNDNSASVAAAVRFAINGDFDLRGASKTAWTYASGVGTAGSMAIGDDGTTGKEITATDATGWRQGDRIVFASTQAYNATPRVDVLTLHGTNYTNGSTTLVFTTGLTYQHDGGCLIGNLTRNVILGPATANNLGELAITTATRATTPYLRDIAFVGSKGTSGSGCTAIYVNTATAISEIYNCVFDDFDNTAINFDQAVEALNRQNNIFYSTRSAATCLTSSNVTRTLGDDIDTCIFRAAFGITADLVGVTYLRPKISGVTSRAIQPLSNDPSVKDGGVWACNTAIHLANTRSGMAKFNGVRFGLGPDSSHEYANAVNAQLVTEVGAMSINLTNCAENNTAFINAVPAATSTVLEFFDRDANTALQEVYGSMSTTVAEIDRDTSVTDLALSGRSTSALHMKWTGTSNKVVSRSFLILTKTGIPITLIGRFRKDADYAGNQPYVEISGLGITPVRITLTAAANTWEEFAFLPGTATEVVQSSGGDGNLTVTFVGQSSATNGECWFAGVPIAPFVTRCRHYGYLFDESSPTRTADITKSASFATADAYTDFTFSWSATAGSSTATIVADTTFQKLYDGHQADAVQNVGSAVALTGAGVAGSPALFAQGNVTINTTKTLNGAGSLSIPSGKTLTADVPFAFTYTNGTYSKADSSANATFAGGTLDIGAAGTYTFTQASSMTVSATPTSTANYNFGSGTFTGTLTFHNNSAFNVIVEVPAGTTTSSTGSPGPGTVTFSSPLEYQSVTVSGFTTTSRLYIYDYSVAAPAGSRVLYNDVPGATSYTWTDSAAAVATRDIRIRIADVTGVTAKEFIEADIGTCAISGGGKDLTYLASQTADTTYDSNGVDGPSIYATSGITFTDAATDLVNINIAADTVALKTIYACFVHWLHTATGIDDDVAYIDAPDTANYILTSMKIRNTSTDPLKITGGYFYDSTGSVENCVDVAGSSGNIYPMPEHVVPYQTTGTYAITGDIATVLAAIPSDTDNAAAVLAAAQSTPIYADARKMNGATITGTGVDSDLWRGA